MNRAPAQALVCVETALSRRRRGGPRRTVQLTQRDRQLLAFAAENQFVVAGQVALLLEASEGAADARMRALSHADYLVRECRLRAEPATVQITRLGLNAIGSDLSVPHALDLATYRHELGVGWLMVMARRGRFGPLQAVISERRMRSEDARARGQSPGPEEWSGGCFQSSEAGCCTGLRGRHGVRLGGTGPAGGERLHYPDLVLVADTGHRIAFELELTPKARTRREAIMAGYAADPAVDMAIYLVERPQIKNALTRSVARLGVSHLVRVQSVTTGHEPTAAARGGVAERHQVPAAIAGATGGGAER